MRSTGIQHLQKRDDLVWVHSGTQLPGNFIRERLERNSCMDAWKSYIWLESNFLIVLYHIMLLLCNGDTYYLFSGEDFGMGFYPFWGEGFVMILLYYLPLIVVVLLSILGRGICNDFIISLRDLQ